MAWTIEYIESIQKEVRKIDRTMQRRIREYLETRVALMDDPRQLGKPLTGKFSTLWRYRVGNYRIICDLKDETMVVLVVRIAHRSDVYR